MTLKIDFLSEDFPGLPPSFLETLNTSWDEVLWAALTVGRPNFIHVFRHGASSFHEAIFRLSLIRMAVEQDTAGYLRRTLAFVNLDPTEKGMVSYFLGMTMCKLFAAKALNAPWLLHLDVYRGVLNPALLSGRSRPDLVGQAVTGEWFAFESKGRSTIPSKTDRENAKLQAQKIVAIGTSSCSLNIGSIAFFRGDRLEFYWRDPEPTAADRVEIPLPGHRWKYYYEPSLYFSSPPETEEASFERDRSDVAVTLHPKVIHLLLGGRWAEAKEYANSQRTIMRSEGYQADGVKVRAGSSWSKPYEDGSR